MEKQIMSMDELEQVNGGNIFGDAWDWICDKAKDVYEKIKPDMPFDDPVYMKAGR